MFRFKIFYRFCMFKLLREKSSNTQAYLFAFLTVLLWSTVASVFKIALTYYSPVHLLFLSMLVSTGVIGIILIVSNSKSIVSYFNYRCLTRSALSGLMNPLIYYLFLFNGYRLLPAQIAQPVVFVWPIILTILLSLFYKQRITAFSFLGLMLSFLGVFIAAAQGNILAWKSFNISGISFCLLAALTWSVYWLFNIKDSRPALVKLLYNFLFSSLFLSFYLWLKHDLPILSYPEIIAPVYIGIIEMGITFFFWLRALELANDRSKISNLIYLSPVLSLFLIYFILKEPFCFTSIIGLVLILTGIFIQQRKSIN